MSESRNILVLGASGLIGRFVTDDLRARGFHVIGIALGATILTPDLWIEPLGALVKTGPAIVLMLVALLTLDNR